MQIQTELIYDESMKGKSNTFYNEWKRACKWKQEMSKFFIIR